MLRFDAVSGRMWSQRSTLAYADRPYVYNLSVRGSDGSVHGEALVDRVVTARGGGTVVSGRFGASGLELTQRLVARDGGIDEIVSLSNPTDVPVVLDDLGFGWASSLVHRLDWHLVAVPFRVQLDGSVHDYSGADLIAGRYRNAVYVDNTRVEVRLTEDDRLRSEAWLWRAGAEDLVIIKYNTNDIELSVAAAVADGGEHQLRFGGCGSSLYGEPSRGHRLEPGEQFTFGVTSYRLVEGRVEDGARCYRDYLDARGHGFPADYDPPVNWNELYDVGWHHSDEVALREHYTRSSLLREADKAREAGCELLYLDPGWEVAEGTSLWDEDRLGTVASLARELHDDYGLGLGFRTVLRCYRDHWSREYVVRREGETKQPVVWNEQQDFWELCLSDSSFRSRKTDRLVDILRHGVRFLMVDEMDWRGPCVDDGHDHRVPTTASDHVDAVYAMCRELRRRCPGLVIECHDPVWPWSTAVYVPTYYGQGFGESGNYQENWGFEYMWDCISDLKSGKALALYYYNLGCNVPLYLHITMAADNDRCLFFWWAASTVRHLGIGGKFGHATVNPPSLPAHDAEARFHAYRSSMALYRSVKPYLVRGTFHGLCEHAHLHTLAGHAGGVLVVFNLEEAPVTRELSVPLSLLGVEGELAVTGATAAVVDGELRLTVQADAMAPVVVLIGDAVGAGPSPTTPEE